MKTTKMLAILVLVLSVVCNTSAQLPLGWRNVDVGAPSPPGSASYDESTGVWTIKGDGHDIWDESDDFHFVYKPLLGDGQIIAHVISMEETHEWAKAGVMIREDLTGESKHGMMVITPGHAASFQWRATTGGASQFSQGGLMTLPYWVCIERNGNTFTGYISSDGSSWMLQDSVNISMKTEVYIGLVVTSHQHEVLCTAEFDSVSVEGDIGKGTAFTYHGRPMDVGGQVTGIYDFRFALFDYPGGPFGFGTPPLSTVNIDRIDVVEGYYTLELDFGSSVFDGHARWLEIGVRESGIPGDFTIYGPRQELTPTPYAIYAQNVSWGDNDWQIDGANMYSIPSGNVGIGTTDPAEKLQIRASRGPIGTGIDDVFALTTPEDEKILFRYNDQNEYWNIRMSGVARPLAFSMTDNEVMRLTTYGSVGIGTTNPGAKLEIGSSGDLLLKASENDVGDIIFRDSNDIQKGRIWTGAHAGVEKLYLSSGDNYADLTIDESGSIGIGTGSPGDVLHVQGNDGQGVLINTSGSTGLRLHGSSTGVGVITFNTASLRLGYSSDGGFWPTTEGITIKNNGNVGIGMRFPDAKLTIQGDGTILKGKNEAGDVIVEISEGLDYSETFRTSQDEIAPGTVMVIDPVNKGSLTTSTQAYDKKVAGIVAGAKGLGSGVRLGSLSDDTGEHSVALAGRVYCNVDTQYGDIEPGDLLTTSATAGHAMVVKNYAKAQGAILGKAMEELSGGEKGQILVLVTLQ